MFRLYKAAINRLYGRNTQLCMMTVIESCVLTGCLYCCGEGQVSDCCEHIVEFLF
jgi:hypothetical protein